MRRSLVSLCALSGALGACSHDIDTTPPSLASTLPTLACSEQLTTPTVLTGNNLTPLPIRTLRKNKFLELPQISLTETQTLDGMAVSSTPVKIYDDFHVPAASHERWESEQQMTFDIYPELMLPPGVYDITATNPDGHKATLPHSLGIVPPPSVTSVGPNNICDSPLDQTITVHGANFLQIGDATPSVEIFDASGALIATLPTMLDGCVAVAASVMAGVQECSTLTFVAAMHGLPAGTYTLVVKNPDPAGCQSTEAVQFIVRDASAGIVIFYVDPPFVYGQITTPVTVYTTGVITALENPGGVILTKHNDKMAMPIDLTSASQPDPNHPKRLIIDVPPTVPPGTYDLTVTPLNGCPAFYDSAITVKTDKVDLKDMVPPFGYDQANTAVQIDANGSFFKPAARAYLAPHSSTGLARPLTAVVEQNDKQLTAVVPASPAVPLIDQIYDLVVVNTDGTIGFLANAFTAVPNPPPTISGVSPGALLKNCAGAACGVQILGANFSFTGNNIIVNKVDASCTPIDVAGATVTASFNVTPASATQVDINMASPTSGVPIGSMTDGSACVFTLTRSDGTFVIGGTLVVEISSGNIQVVHPGSTLNVARRAAALVGNGPTTAKRFLYAIGGDTGAATTLVDKTTVGGAMVNATVERTPVDLTGDHQAWSLEPNDQPERVGLGPRTYAGAVSIGHFIYVLGGYNAGALTEIKRAKVLEPTESPQVDDADLILDDTAGMMPGLYYYRVAALMPPGDPNNPGGETLAGDEFAINVPAVMGKKVQVLIAWKPGATSSTAIGYRVYRGDLPGQQNLYTDVVGGGTLTFIDKGTLPKTGVPIPFGALGQWAGAAQSIPQLKVARAGAGVAAVDKDGNPNIHYLYAGYGLSGTIGGATLPASYEWFTITTTPATATTAELQAVAANNAGNAVASGGTGRWLIGGYGVTPNVDPIIAAQRYVYFGDGTTRTSDDTGGNTLAGATDQATVTAADGSLGNYAILTTGKATGRNGYGSATAANILYAFGGRSSIDQKNIIGLSLTDATGGVGTQWNTQGTGVLTDSTMTNAGIPTYLPAVTLEQPFFYIVGGSPNNTSSAQDVTQYAIY